MTESRRFIEVCAGCGGLSLGLMEAGWEPILLNEIDKTCCETLRENHPEVEVIQKSMTDLNVEEYRGRVDLLTGGVPCQSFSQAGLRRGLEDERGGLIMEFARLVDECEPKIFMIENVKGLITHQGGETIRLVKEHLSRDGNYKVHHKLLKAVEYGVPQKRERVFIIGIHRSMEREWKYPEPTNERKVLRDVLVDVPESPGYSYPERKREIMEMVPEGGCWVDLPEEIQEEYMGASLHSGGGKRGIARRLSMDEPCLTLTTSPCQKQTERCHPTETRPLTIREYARIQTFPDSFVFKGTVAKQYKQIGNAVPVKLANVIGIALIEYLEENIRNDV